MVVVDAVWLAGIAQSSHDAIGVQVIDQRDAGTRTFERSPRVAAAFETDPPHALFDTGIRASFVNRRNQYVVTRDGQRFLVNVSAEDENSAPITVVLNWQSRLKH